MLGYATMQKKSNMLRIVQCATLRMWYVNFKLSSHFLIVGLFITIGIHSQMQ